MFSRSLLIAAVAFGLAIFLAPTVGKSHANDETETVVIYKNETIAKAHKALEEKPVSLKSSGRFLRAMNRFSKAMNRGKLSKASDVLLKFLEGDKLQPHEELMAWQNLSNIASELGDEELVLKARLGMVRTKTSLEFAEQSRIRFQLIRDYMVNGNISSALELAEEVQAESKGWTITETMLAAQLYYAVGQLERANELALKAISRADKLTTLTAKDHWHQLAEFAAKGDATLELSDLVHPLLDTEEKGVPMPLVHIQPRYPVEASDRNIEGHVTLSFAINADGSVNQERIRLVESEPKGYFEQAAVGALIKFRYSPARQDGVPVPYEWLNMKFEFKARKPKK